MKSPGERPCARVNEHIEDRGEARADFGQQPGGVPRIVHLWPTCDKVLVLRRLPWVFASAWDPPRRSPSMPGSRRTQRAGRDPGSTTSNSTTKPSPPLISLKI